MAQHPVLTSPTNPLLKDVRRAVARGALTSEGLLVADTVHLLEEALRSGLDVKVVLVAESAYDRVRDLPAIRVTVLDDALFETLGDTESSQGVIALVEPPSWTLEQTLLGQSLIIVLDALQDPGNAGAIVRAAEAFGASGVAFTKGTVSPFNPKTLRAAAGSLFRVPFVSGIDAEQIRMELFERRIDLYTAIPATGTLASVADLTRPCAIAIGSEAHGVGQELRRDGIALSIPTTGVESLNAAVAAGVLLYEAQRQRSLKP